MASELLSSTTSRYPTIWRRWDSSKRAYIRTDGTVIPQPDIATDAPSSSPTAGDHTADEPDSCVPPADGSAPFLGLPTELRLQVYSYLTSSDPEVRWPLLKILRGLYESPKSQKPKPTTYVYLYRSPGRVTKVGDVSRQIRDLFGVCRTMREELIDCCFGDRTFVLEASFYSRSVGGLDVLPPRLPQTAWVKHLLIVTVLDKDKIQPKGMCNMLPLQEMTNLKTLRILFRVAEPVDPLKVANSPIWSIVSCVPARTTVTFGFESADGVDVAAEITDQFGSTLDYMLHEDSNSTVAYARYNANTDLFNDIKGTLSGSRVNHASCRYPTCQEKSSGIRCVNSQTPNARPTSDAAYSIGAPSKYNYSCGCTIRVGDGGFSKHSCPNETVAEITRTTTISDLRREIYRSPQRAVDRDFEQMKSEVKPEQKAQSRAEDWRASLHRRRRLWKSWGGE